VNVRNLDEIQEHDRPLGSSRAAALLLASLAGAAIVTAVVVMARRSGPPAQATRDPLAELVREVKNEPTSADKLASRDVSFPSLLSDDESPTTALAAVRDERGRLIAQGDAPAPTAPPAPADRLPVVPLPVGDLLGATPVTTEPKDGLTTMAAGVAKIPDKAELAPPGMDGGFQLQVASFKEEADAQKLVDDLRRRGHRAYSLTADVPNRGNWHRVRIGPFKTKFEAMKYKADFERTERASPFVVDPDKVRRAEEIRSERLAARERKDKKR